MRALTSAFDFDGLELECYELREVEDGFIVHGEVAATWRLLLVVLFGEVCADESEHYVVVGNKVMMSVRRSVSVSTRSSGFVRQILRQ